MDCRKWTADLPRREYHPKTRILLLPRVYFGSMNACKGPEKRRIHTKSESNSLSCRLYGGGRVIRTLRRLFEAGQLGTGTHDRFDLADEPPGLCSLLPTSPFLDRNALPVASRTSQHISMQSDVSQLVLSVFSRRGEQHRLAAHGWAPTRRVPTQACCHGLA
jgi:hypothetical protein